jgi:hypothetical protein
MAAWLLLVLLLIYDFIQEVFAAVCYGVSFDLIGSLP